MEARLGVAPWPAWPARPEVVRIRLLVRASLMAMVASGPGTPSAWRSSSDSQKSRRMLSTTSVLLENPREVSPNPERR
eukprot:335031-Prorocentrum_minimum.AAC.1